MFKSFKVAESLALSIKK